MVAEPTSTRWSRSWSWCLIALLVLGVGLRLAYVHRPFDHRLENPWRQADYLQIARNFHAEGMNPFYPRIDWRGDAPGYAEMELPLLPWLAAAVFPLTGPRVQVLRTLAAAFEIGALLLFAGLARRLLPPGGALFAVAAFALNPILLLLAPSPQPDPVMHLFSLAAVSLLWAWYRTPRLPTLLAAGAMLGLAAAAKLPALTLGLLFAYLILRRRGMRALAEPGVYLAALLALLPAAGWYLWSHRFWTAYGLSLGLSNETHLLGLDMLFPPTFLAGILKWEILGVFSPFGWILALAAFRRPRSEIELPAAWYAAVWVFYLASARTAGDGWAYYYHAMAAAPGCLLMGAGLAALGARALIPDRLAAARWQPQLGWLLAAGSLVALLGVTALKIDRRDHDPYLAGYHACALELAPHIPLGGRIVVRGGSTHDPTGRPVAHNESMVFAWIDRKGFNYGDQELSLETLESIAARGGRYWIARTGELSDPELARQVAARYARLAVCSTGRYSLYDLRDRDPANLLRNSPGEL